MAEKRWSRAFYNLALRYFPRQTSALAGFLLPLVHRILPGLLATSAGDREFLKLLRVVREASDPPLELNKLVAANEMTLQQGGEAIRHVFLNRDPAFIRLCTSDTPLFEPLNVLASIYKGEYQGTSVDPATLQAQWNSLENSEYQLTAADRLYLLIAAVRSKSLPLVEAVLTSLASASVPVLPSVHKIGILRLVMSEEPQNYAQWRERLKLTPVELLQAADMDARAGLSDIHSHAQFAKRLISVLPSRLGRQLKTRVLPFYEARDHQAVWMDCRLRADVLAAFLDAVKQALISKTSWCIIRLGDGESYAWWSRLTTEQITMREQVWWGTTIETGLRQQIAAEALEAITRADVLGIPAFYRFAGIPRQRSPRMKPTVRWLAS